MPWVAPPGKDGATDALEKHAPESRESLRPFDKLRTGSLRTGVGRFLLPSALDLPHYSSPITGVEALIPPP